MNESIKKALDPFASFVPGIKPWMLTVIGFLFIQTAAAIWWAAVITQQVSDIPAVKKQIAIALKVVADHGGEIEGIRNRQERLDGNIAGVFQLITKNTDDRFRRRDWLVEKEALKAQRESDIRYCDLRLSRLEDSIKLKIHGK